jgi:amino acid permease
VDFSYVAGIAAFGNSPSAIISALLLIAIIGGLSGYGFALIGKVCAYTGATSYRDAWNRSVGKETSWIPAYSATCKTFMACLAISMVLADTFATLLNRTEQRNTVLVGFTTLILLPLCWMKSLAALAPFSLLGIVGMIFTGGAMALRFFDKSYQLPDGPLLATVAKHLRPQFGKKGMSAVMSPSSLVLACMLSTAYMAQYV